MCVDISKSVGLWKFKYILKKTKFASFTWEKRNKFLLQGFLSRDWKRNVSFEGRRRAGVCVRVCGMVGVKNRKWRREVASGQGQFDAVGSDALCFCGTGNFCVCSETKQRNESQATHWLPLASRWTTVGWVTLGQLYRKSCCSVNFLVSKMFVLTKSCFYILVLFI